VVSSQFSGSSFLFFVPPFPERYAAAVSIKRDEENSVEAGLQPGRNDNKGRPPTGKAYFRGDGKNFVAELNVLFGLRATNTQILPGGHARLPQTA
jgi:hypothetical protein